MLQPETYSSCEAHPLWSPGIEMGTVREFARGRGFATARTVTAMTSPDIGRFLMRHKLFFLASKAVSG